MINIVMRMAEECKSILGDKACVALPLFHAFGLGVPCMHLALGGTVYIPEKVKAQDIADIVSREHISDIWSVGAVYQSIIDSKEFTDKCAPFVKMCAIAGSYTSPVQFTRFEAALNHSTFLNMFGMTETASVFIMACPEDSVQVRYNTITLTTNFRRKNNQSTKTAGFTQGISELWMMMGTFALWDVSRTSS